VILFSWMVTLKRLLGTKTKGDRCDTKALPLIVFDVNETLLDLQTLEPMFERTFG